MADTMVLWDGNVQIVFSTDDFLQLVDEYMGMDARRYLEEKLNGSEAAWAYTEEVEKERDGWRNHYREVIKEIRNESEMLSKLISEKELDLREISNVCGRIGIITYKEMNTT